MTEPAKTNLSELRARIDELDRALLNVVSERLEVCREVARLKAAERRGIIQPDRVREVLRTRLDWAGELGVETEFAEQLFRVFLAETHRIEADEHTDAAIKAKRSTHNAALDTALQTAACRIDHVTIAVHDLGKALAYFVDGVGFHVRDHRPADGWAVVDGGGVTLVLVSGPAVAAHLDRYGPGIQHVGIEVLNATYVRDALAAAGVALLTDVVADDDGLEQFFTTRDDASGLQLGFVSRTGERSRYDGGNVPALFDALNAAAEAELG